MIWAVQPIKMMQMKEAPTDKERETSVGIIEAEVDKEVITTNKTHAIIADIMSLNISANVVDKGTIICEILKWVI